MSLETRVNGEYDNREDETIMAREVRLYRMKQQPYAFPSHFYTRNTDDIAHLLANENVYRVLPKAVRKPCVDAVYDGGAQLTENGKYTAKEQTRKE